MSSFARRLQSSSHTTAPLPETTVTVTDVTDTTATLSWTVVPGATGYLVGRDGNDSHGNGPYQTVDPVGTTSRQFVWLEPDTTYTLYCEPQPGGPRKTIEVTTNATTPPDTSSPIADAGSLPVGQASYSVPGGAVFVATTGNDSSGNGTQAAPYKTLSKAVSASASGSTIVMRAGSYNEGSDTQGKAYVYGITLSGGKQLTVQNYPGEAVWFDGSVTAGSFTSSGGLWYCSYDRIFDRSPTSAHGQADGWGADTGAGGWWTTSENPQAAWPDMVLLDGVQLQQVQTKAEVTTGKFWIEGTDLGDMWFQGSKIWIGDNPAGHEVRYANKTKLLTTTGAGTKLTMKGIGVRRYASYNAGFCTIYGGMNIDLENVWFEDLSASAIGMYGGTAYNFTKVTARRIGFNFTQTNQSNNIVMDRMDLQYCNYAGFNVYGPATRTIAVAKTQYITLKNSIVSNNNSNGLWTDQTTATPIAVNCIFENNMNRPIDYETSSDGIVANCKFINNASVSVFINDSDTTRLWNNTFSGNSWGVAGNGGPHGENTTTSVPLIQVGQSSRRYDVSMYSYCIDPRLPSTYYTDVPKHQWTINSFEIVNNIMARAGVNTYSMMICGNNGDATRDPNRKFQPDFHPTMDGNVYHWGSNKPPYPWATANGYQQNYSIYQSLTAFQSGTNPNLDTHSTFATDDPLNADLTLKDSSLHNNATGLPSDIAALIGQPAGTKHIGCFW